VNNLDPPPQTSLLDPKGIWIWLKWFNNLWVWVTDRKPTLATAQDSTSGTSIDFTGIPSWVTRITVMLVGVSTNGTSNPLIQIGDSGGIETTGYLGASGFIGPTNTTSTANYTIGFGLVVGAAANVMHGIIKLNIQDASTNAVVCSGTVALSSAAYTVHTAGSKSLSATLDRVRITTVNGTDTFDAGSINIIYD